MKKAMHGFTLLELLIAMSIFTLLAIAAYHLINGVLRAEGRISTAQSQLRDVQRALSMFERDLSQAVGPLGNKRSATDVTFVGDAQSLAFIRGGWGNPRNQARSNLQQVSYAWSDQAWIRSAGNGAQPQRILQNVDLKSVSYIDHLGGRHLRWPSGMVGRAPMPAAVEIIFDAPGYPALRRLLLLAGGALPPSAAK